MDIVDKLTDLHKQATTERSHYYVGATVKEAADEILVLRAALRMFVSIPKESVDMKAELRQLRAAFANAEGVLGQYA